MQEIRIKLEQNDYRDFLFFHMYRGFKGKMKLALPFILIPVMYAALVQSGRTENMNALFVVSVIAVAYTALLPVLLLFIAKNTYAKSAQLKQEAFYSFAAEGIKAKGTSFNGTVSWDKFFAAGISGRALYMYTSASKALIVPFRFFGSETDAQEAVKLDRKSTRLNSSHH